MSAIPARLLPRFSNRTICANCGRGYGIRVEYSPAFDDDAGARFNRVCDCGHSWAERATPPDDRRARRGPLPESPSRPTICSTEVAA